MWPNSASALEGRARFGSVPAFRKTGTRTGTRAASWMRRRVGLGGRAGMVGMAAAAAGAAGAGAGAGAGAAGEARAARAVVKKDILEAISYSL